MLPGEELLGTHWTGGLRGSQCRCGSGDEEKTWKECVATVEIKRGIERSAKQMHRRMTDFVKENYCVICESLSNIRRNLVIFLINCLGVSINYSCNLAAREWTRKVESDSRFEKG
jgi:hypothetical protein